MAGFFGLFNYEKEGPGISKDAPKKKTFIVFFETFFRNFWKFITINLVYFVISIPLITNGLASAGLTNVTRNIARDKHSFGLSDFFETVKKNWKQSLIVSIINTVITAVLIFAISFYYNNSNGIINTIGLSVSFCIALIFLMMNFYIWTMIITFKLSIKQIYRNSFKFVFINMKMNLLCGIVLLLVYAVYIAIFLLIPNYLVLTVELILILCTLPAFRFLLIQFCTFPSIKKYIIDPYYEEHPDEDIELRRNLGIEIENEIKNEDESETDGIDTDE